jgi:PAS domain-containing protein
VPQRHLALILAREFSSKLATPTLIADAEGRIVYFNEAAEAVVGHTFAEAGPVPLDDFTGSFAPRSADGRPLPPDERPARIALRSRRPAHMRYAVTSRDGVAREVSVTAVPLFARADEFVGVLVVFWREGDAPGA